VALARAGGSLGLSRGERSDLPGLDQKKVYGCALSMIAAAVVEVLRQSGNLDRLSGNMRKGSRSALWQTSAQGLPTEGNQR